MMRIQLSTFYNLTTHKHTNLTEVKIQTNIKINLTKTPDTVMAASNLALHLAIDRDQNFTEGI